MYLYKQMIYAVIAGDSLLDRKEKTTPDRLEGFFYFIALCLKTIKSPFHPNAKQ